MIEASDKVLLNENDVETVVLLRRKKVDGYIEVNLETNGEESRKDKSWR